MRGSQKNGINGLSVWGDRLQEYIRKNDGLSAHAAGTVFDILMVDER